MWVQGMMMMRTRNTRTRLGVLILSVTLVCLTCSAGAPAGGALRGFESAGEAARPTRSETGEPRFTLLGWRPSSGFLTASAYSDTTEVEFPEEDEQGRKHLARDIGVFVMVSAFVGYFLVKVFFEGDTENTSSDDGGKKIPGGGV
jgi:hypothetical protein